MGLPRQLVGQARIPLRRPRQDDLLGFGLRRRHRRHVQGEHRPPRRELPLLSDRNRRPRRAAGNTQAARAGVMPALCFFAAVDCTDDPPAALANRPRSYYVPRNVRHRPQPSRIWRGGPYPFARYPWPTVPAETTPAPSPFVARANTISRTSTSPSRAPRGGA